MRERIGESLKAHGGIDDSKAFERLLGLFRFVGGDYADARTFAAIRAALPVRGVRRTILPFRPPYPRPSFRHSAHLVWAMVRGL